MFKFFNNQSKLLLAAHIFIAYIFSVFSRFSLYYKAKENPDFSIENKIVPIWTADAGLYGGYAKEILSGANLPFNSEYAAGHLIAFVASASSLDLDAVMFFIPAFLASLIVIPIILLGRLYQMPIVGFAAALLGSIGSNYYYRTHLGYADTDMLIFPLSFLILYALCALSHTKNLFYAILAVLFSAALLGWYHSAKPLVFGFFLFFIAYSLVFDLKDLKANKPYRFFILGSIASLVAAISVFGLQSSFYARALEYFNKPKTLSITDASGAKLEMDAMLGWVSESGSFDFWESLQYIGGHWIFVALGIVGAVALFFKHKSFLFIWIPLIVGLFSFKLGIRFATFAVIPIWFGVAYLLSFAAQKLDARLGRISVNSVLIMLFALLLAFNLKQAQNYNSIIKPVLDANEARMLRFISAHADKNNVLISWWDVGWPMRYFSNLNPLVDNGKFDIDTSVCASVFLSPNPIFSANAAGYFANSYAQSGYDGYVLDKEAKKQNLGSLINSLESKEFQLKKETDVYFYFSDSLIDKLPVISKFAILGSALKQDRLLQYFPVAKPFSQNDRYIYAPDFALDRQKGKIATKDGKEGPVSGFFISDGEKFSYQRFFPNADYNIIVYKNKHIIVADNASLNSFFVKGYLLNSYDKTLFDVASQTQTSKILKLK